MPNAQLDAVIDLLTGREPLENPTVHDSRKRFEKLMRVVGGDTAASILTVDVDGVPGELVSSGETSSGRAVLYLHGGGYVIGSPNTHKELTRRLSVAADADALVIDYRLAPENPFPAAVEDAVSAYKWLIGQGCDPADIAIAGDSAGGGLTVAALVSLKEQGVSLPACGVCISPWVDMEGLGESMTSRAALDPMVQREGLVAMGESYLNGADPRTPLAAPLYADLSGLPPLLIQVGTSETLYDDATRLAEKAEAAGVETCFESWEEMTHVWHLFAPMLDEGQRAIERIGEYVRAKTTAMS